MDFSSLRFEEIEARKRGFDSVGDSDSVKLTSCSQGFLGHYDQIGIFGYREIGCVGSSAWGVSFRHGGCGLYVA